MFHTGISNNFLPSFDNLIGHVLVKSKRESSILLELVVKYTQMNMKSIEQ